MFHQRIPPSALDMIPLLLRSVSNQQLSMVIRLAGKVEIERLKASLEALLTQHPLLCFELLWHGGRPAWVNLGQPTSERICLKIIDDHDESTEVQRMLASNEPGRAVVAITLLRGRIHDILCITVDHTVADAYGTKEITYALAENYRATIRNTTIEQQPAPPNRKVLDASSCEHPLRYLSDLSGHAFTRGKWQFPNHVQGGPWNTHYSIRHIGADSLSQLKGRCAQSGATVNDVLIAALFFSLARILSIKKGTRLPVQFTVDLRRYLVPNDRHAIANLSSSTVVWLRHRNASNFRQLIRETQLEITKLKNRRPGLATAVALERLIAAFPHLMGRVLLAAFRSSGSSGKANPVHANFGAISEQRLNFGQLRVKDAFLAGPSLNVPGIMLGTSAFRNQLTFSVGYDTTIVDKSFIDSLLSEMSSCLLQEPG